MLGGWLCFWFSLVSRVCDFVPVVLSNYRHHGGGVSLAEREVRYGVQRYPGKRVDPP